MTTQVYLAGLTTQGTNQLPFGFWPKNRNRQLQAAKQNTKKKNKKLLHTAAAEDVSMHAAIAPVW